MTVSLRDALPLRGGVLERFRSITFLMEPDTCEGLNPSPTRIAAWMERFNTWFMEQVGVQRGHGQHLLYDREVTLFAQNLLAYADAVHTISGAVRPLGFLFSISVFAREILNQQETLQALVSDGMITSIGVTLDEWAVADAPAALLEILEYLVRARVSIGIIGDIGTFHAVHAFESPVLSAADLTWYPISRSLTSNDAKNVVPVAQCYSRFRLHVDSTGNIFPCLGLVGLPNCSLGTLDEPLTETGLGSTEILAELDEWNRIGPDIAAPVVPVEAAIGYLPLMCQWHRNALGA